MTNTQKDTYYENIWRWIRTKEKTTEYIDSLIETERKRNNDFEDKKKILLRIKDIMITENSIKEEIGEDIKLHNYTKK